MRNEPRSPSRQRLVETIQQGHQRRLASKEAVPTPVHEPEAAGSGRNIVLCCDGTGKAFGDANTNVVRLYGLLARDEHQLAYYDPGVGTLSLPGPVSGLAKKWSLVRGLAFGIGLNDNIQDAYRFLMEHYRDGDHVYLFGFSRGAFTVRALAGMLYTCGLLHPGNANLVPYAHKMYRQRGNDQLAADFKTVFGRPCKPCFVGVWDTVKSVGFFLPRRFPNARLNPDVAHGRHALAIDEKRGMYQPYPWEAPPPQDAATTGSPDHHHGDDEHHGPDIVQRWFCGMHSDVGGGYADSSDLSDVTLSWMIEEAEACGLRLVDGWHDGVRPNPAGVMHNTLRTLRPPWALLPFARRSMPPDAELHESVAERRAAVPDYQPKLHARVGLIERSIGYLPCLTMLAILGAVGLVLGSIGARGVLAAAGPLRTGVPELLEAIATAPAGRADQPWRGGRDPRRRGRVSLSAPARRRLTPPRRQAFCQYLIMPTTFFATYRPMGPVLYVADATTPPGRRMIPVACR